jgi:hypothetical protein
MSLVCPLLATSSQIGAGVAFSVRFPLSSGGMYGPSVPGSRVHADSNMGSHVCESVHTGLQADLFTRGSPLGKILLGGGGGLISTSFPNTLLDSCCAGMTGIPFFWFIVTLISPAGIAISVFPSIMYRNYRKIRPCKGLVK